MVTSRLIIALGTFAITAWAQTSTGVAGPVAGFVFGGSSGSVRPMLGIPGAAYLGDALATGLDKASVAPDGSAVLTVQQAGKLVLYTGLRTSAPVAVNVAGGIADVDRFAWSPDAASAAVYSSASGQAQIVSGLVTAPSGSSPISLKGLSGPVAVLSFDGQRLIVGVPGGIYLVSAQSAAQKLAAAASPCAISLAGGSLFFADSQTQQIWQVQSYATVPAAVLFASDNTINSPAGLQVSADGKRLLVANAGNRKLAVYDIASQSALQSLDLAFTPTRMDRFGDAATFLLNEGNAQGPLYVAKDSGPGQAAVFFVPVPAQKRPVKPPVRRMH